MTETSALENFSFNLIFCYHLSEFKMGPWVKVKGTGRVDWGSYKPGNQTRSGRNTQRPQW